MSDKTYTKKELRAEFRKDYEKDARNRERNWGCERIQGTLVKIHRMDTDDNFIWEGDGPLPDGLRPRHVEVTTRYAPGIDAGYIVTGNWGDLSDEPRYVRETYYWVLEWGDIDHVHGEPELKSFAAYERRLARESRRQEAR